MEKKFQFLRVKESTGINVSSPEAVYDYMAPESYIDRECFWVLHLNPKNEIIEKELVSMGSVDGAQVHPREVFKKAILNGSCKVVCVHNHPTGDSTPSNADKFICNQIISAGYLLGIAVVDFMIISPKGFNSFSEKRMFRESKEKAKSLIFQAFNGSIGINPENGGKK